MKRVGRWLFNFAAVVSLALCAASAGVCLRSFWFGDQIELNRFRVRGTDVVDQGVAVLSGRGGLTLIWSSEFHPAQSQYRINSYRKQFENRGGAFIHRVETSPNYGGWLRLYRNSISHKLGFFYVNLDSSSYNDLSAVGMEPIVTQAKYRKVVFPTVIFSFITALLPTWYTIRSIKFRRMKRLGRCAICGYDLRATPERCPECGAIPAAPIGPLTSDR